MVQPDDSAWVSSAAARQMAPLEDRSLQEMWQEDEGALLEALLAGNESAFDHLADEYFPKVYRFVQRKLSDPEASRDVTQTALGSAMHQLASFRRESSLLTWLCACAHNEVRMHRRKEMRSRQVDVADEQLEAVARHTPPVSEMQWGPRPVSAERQVMRAERAELVHQTLEQMPEKNAAALQMKYLQSWPVARIAAALDLTEKAAESLLTRSRVAFKREFERLETASATGKSGREGMGV
jgi:RNA polymerase sigma-70 factor (ECF subfamily)